MLLKGYTMKKVVVGLVLALTVAACSAPTTEPANTMVTPEPTSQKLKWWGQAVYLAIFRLLTNILLAF